MYKENYLNWEVNFKREFNLDGYLYINLANKVPYIKYQMYYGRKKNYYLPFIYYLNNQKFRIIVSLY